MSAHKPTQTRRPLQVSGISALAWNLSASVSAVVPLVCRLSASGVFGCVGPLSPLSHTPWITWTSGRTDDHSLWARKPFSIVSILGSQRRGILFFITTVVSHQTRTGWRLCLWAALRFFYLCFVFLLFFHSGFSNTLLSPFAHNLFLNYYYLYAVLRILSTW